jgi:rSAM/selenodomain-associated transferase 2
MERAMRLSVVIPVLNEEKGIVETLENVARCAPEAEVLIVDGGSTDATLERVTSFLETRMSKTPESSEPALWRLLRSERGRGRQMNLGAAHATGDTLLFLHADTHLPSETIPLLKTALANPHVLGGNFRIRFVPPSPVANLYNLIYNARSRIRIFYGDSALWVRRPVFEELGGYPLERVMEDFALVLRLRRAGRLVCLPAVVESSARRFQGVRRNTRALLIWGWLHLLLMCGAGDETLERFYPPIR